MFVRESQVNCARHYRIMTKKCFHRGFITSAHLFKTTTDYEEFLEADTLHESQLNNSLTGNIVRSAVMLHSRCEYGLRQTCRCRKGRCEDVQCRFQRQGRVCNPSYNCQRKGVRENEEHFPAFDPDVPTQPSTPNTYRGFSLLCRSTSCHHSLNFVISSNKTTDSSICPQQTSTVSAKEHRHSSFPFRVQPNLRVFKYSRTKRQPFK